MNYLLLYFEEESVNMYYGPYSLNTFALNMSSH